MEVLTKKDIQTFVEGHFQNSVAFVELRQALPSEANFLLDNITEKAQGVFLWVSWAVKALLDGLREGDSLHDLQEILDELPSDLEELFDRIWSSINPRYKGQTSQFFQLRGSALEHITTVTFWLADDIDSLSIHLDDISPLQLTHIIQRLRRRLDSRTRGLLEISPAGHLDYMHRTVCDWAGRNWDKICAGSSEEFDPNLMLLKASVIEFGEADLWERRVSSVKEEFSRRKLRAFEYASKVRSVESNLPLLRAIMDRFQVSLARHGPVRATTAERNSRGVGFPSYDNKAHSFIGLAAQYGILLYVRAVVAEDASIMETTVSRISLLSEAVLGFPQFIDEADRHYIEKENSFRSLFNSQKRLELVTWLVARGGLPSRSSSEGQHFHESVEPMTRKRQLEAEHFADDDFIDQVNYWEAVRSVLRKEAAKPSKSLQEADTISRQLSRSLRKVLKLQ
ncbi:hypothetical protein PG993_007504 [Apiospora rasikravindrae]|uniref:DUF7791 domain-containing protein n=1 Tax=Apiospora rasikravindrae TaxID=990691 RepID=A0ABR1SZY6_9PEZI